MLIIHRELPKLPEFIISVQDWYHVPAGEADRFSPNRLRHTGTGEAYTSDADRDMAVDNSEVSMRRYITEIHACRVSQHLLQGMVTYMY